MEFIFARNLGKIVKIVGKVTVIIKTIVKGYDLKKWQIACVA